jgi:prepilin-type N-terminal cleavage/methylation domain-containing protein
MAVTRSRNGFSLIEVMIAVVLVGLSITALAVATGSFTMANGAGADLSTAEFLVEQIRELTTLLRVAEQSGTGTAGWTTFGPEEGSLASYDDVDDFDNATFSPPINASRGTLNDLAGFSQQVTVQNISDTNFDTVVTDRSSSFVRVTVSVYQGGQLITSTSWIRARY